MTGEKKVLLNALHASGGGGLVYLRGFLEVERRSDGGLKGVLLLPWGGKGLVGEVPPSLEVKEAPKLGFWGKHLYEQCWLPLLQRRWGCDVMLCNANYGPLLARRLVPIIHTTPRAAGTARGIKMRLYWMLLVLLTRLSLWRAWRVLAVAEHVLGHYGGHRLRAKAVVAHPGAPAPLGKQVLKDSDLVVAVGDIYAQKRYPLIVEAFARLLKERPATRLEIIGRPVDAAAVAALEQALDDHGVRGAVQVVAGLPHGELMVRMASATVLVSTSRAECFNLPLLEAMSVGTAVVAGDYDFQLEVTGWKGAVLIDMEKGNVADALAVALYALLENDTLARQVARSGLARAAEFDWNRTAAIIRETVTGGGLAAEP